MPLVRFLNEPLTVEGRSQEAGGRMNLLNSDPRQYR
jgi:hypothetical protein